MNVAEGSIRLTVDDDCGTWRTRTCLGDYEIVKFGKAQKNWPVVVLAEFVADVVGIVCMLTGHLVVELVAKILVFVVAVVFAVEVVFGHYL